LFYTYVDVLQPFMMKLTRSATDTEELIQETFMRIWMSRDKLEAVRSLHAWIYTIAANECYKYLKKRNGRQRDHAVLGRDEGGEDRSVLDGLNLKEVNRLVVEAVDRLAPGRRRIYEMSRNEGLTIPEIASRLQISPNTVKNTLVTSLKFIRKWLAERGHEL